MIRPESSAVLQSWPYHPWHYIPLSGYLAEQCYTDYAIETIVRALEACRSLRSLVAAGLLEPDDLPSARRLVREGRRWLAAYMQSRAAAESSERAYEDRERARIERTYPVDRSVPASAAIVPPELEDLDELLGPGDPDREYEARYQAALAELATADGDPDPRLCPCGRTVETDPCVCDSVLDAALAETFEPFDPMGPTDADWDRLRAAARDWPPSGGID